MGMIINIHQKAKKKNKLIVLPEAQDKRVQQAAQIIQKEKIARVILLDKNNLEDNKKKEYAQVYYELQKHKGISIGDAARVLEEPLYYAALMTRSGDSDGFVAGASYTTPNVARAAIYCLGVDERISIASSCFLMYVPDCAYGQEGAFIFADCGIVPEPDARQLACIAISSSELAEEVFGIPPRVALLSYSTKNSAKGKFVDKVKEALDIANKMKPDLMIDGELQVDAAIVPEVARIKDPASKLGGRANVLIFPDLEAGNIGYKLVQRLAGARAVGPLIVGLNKPSSDLSRGCSVEDIVDCVAVTALRAK
ncbi:MAG: phosphate acetyltransferase [Candidatus Omnitrophota bacterium]|nr:MAG: phosphate acetyltransferase [Candidatus Omnitrophota bacterium]